MHVAGRLDRLATLEVAGADSGDSAPVECAGCQVLVRGYVANRGELCTRLGLAGAEHPTDGELVAHAFRAWGRDLAAHVLGEYAAVVLDRHANSALLTHDSLGLAPLFYGIRGDSLVFSTRLADLVDRAASASLDDEYIADFLALGCLTTERTPYRSIKRLLPGRSVWWSGGRLSQLTGWDLAGAAPLRRRDDGEYEEEFRALLGDAVRGALATSGSLWSHLSGGLDSSTVTSMAATLGAPGLAAFSLVAPGLPDADERRWMRAVVDLYDLPWHQLDMETVLPFSRLPDDFLGEPTPSVVDAEQIHVRRELFGSHGVTTVLTGAGGDGALGAFHGPIATHLADRLFDGHPIAALRDVADWKRGSREHRSSSYWMLRSVLEPTVDHLRGRAILAGVKLPLQPWIEPGYASAMRLDERSGLRVAPRCRHPGRQRLWDSLWIESLAMGAVAQRAQPYDVRSPLLYRPLVEFMCGIPWEQKLRPRCDRYLQRRALEGVLPELVRRRTSKRDGSRALIEGLRRSPQWFEYLTDESLLARRGIAGGGEWRRAVQQAALGQTHGDQFFIAGVAVEVWLRQLQEHLRGAPDPILAAV
jgi:asparagine synthase (glutamine-hydrolysing)